MPDYIPFILSVHLNISNFAVVYIDFMSFQNMILYIDLRHAQQFFQLFQGLLGWNNNEAVQWNGMIMGI